MKLNCGISYAAKIRRLEDWHLWFAWKPVRVGEHDCRWLEYVERKGRYCDAGWDAFWSWEYRGLP